ncbi:hypothetical protein N7492_004658 [Penicillium capsulatum]|uniref:Uncharacterized protein n=1 Tax=Penicillium capsulatum TaxID=69766 RepID=A0A9W9I874_9EURO|nr:hypothetical protein N7492_004658 [Penicillium capsulatum]KAJ6136230.1 hypothetical protein N7512_001390 [Penicillium capsulatum]
MWRLVTKIPAHSIGPRLTVLGIMNYMTDTVTSAFGMIEGGQQALDKHPIDHEVAELAGWLFAKQDFDVVEREHLAKTPWR